MPMRPPVHRPPGHRSSDAQRPSAAKRGYGRKWQQAREGYLKRHPWCVHCAAAGIREPATRVDHIVPHRGDMVLFWDKTNWQSLCETHHNIKARAERLSTPLKA